MAIDMSKALAFSAVSGIVAGIAGCGGSQAAPANAEPAKDPAAMAPAGSAAPADAAAVEKHSCKGQNSCKGNGGCKTDKNACKGQNSCKGQGGCKTA